MHPKLRADAVEMYRDICKALTGKALCRFAYTLRTFQEQDELYAQGRTKAGKIVTNARGGQSYHNYGLAFDIVLLKDTNADGKFETASWETNVDFDGDGKADWLEAVVIAKHYGYEWGGDWSGFKDRPHFQQTFGRSTKSLLTDVRLGNVDGAGYVIL